MPAPISEDARQICFWLPVHMVKWLKTQGSIRGTIIKLIENAMYD